MDKTEFLDNLSEAVSQEVNHSQVERIIAKASTLLDTFWEAAEKELWEGWTIAQGITLDQTRDRVLEEERILHERVDEFHARRHAFNQWIATYHKHRSEDHPEGSEERKQLDAFAAEAATDDACCGHNHDEGNDHDHDSEHTE